MTETKNIAKINGIAVPAIQPGESYKNLGLHRRALASDQSQAIKLVNISQLLHFSNTIRCGNPAENKGSGLETEPPVSVIVLIRCLTDHI